VTSASAQIIQHPGIHVRSHPENHLTEPAAAGGVKRQSEGVRAVNGSKNSNSVDGDKRRDYAEDETRPQRGGEAETTRFGMEDGDNTDIPTTGEGSRPDDAEAIE
jgi:hypothetical protein